MKYQKARSMRQRPRAIATVSTSARRTSFYTAELADVRAVKNELSLT
jgi:hypothetical protein